MYTFQIWPCRFIGSKIAPAFHMFNQSKYTPRQCSITIGQKFWKLVLQSSRKTFMGFSILPGFFVEFFAQQTSLSLGHLASWAEPINPFKISNVVVRGLTLGLFLLSSHKSGLTQLDSGWKGNIFILSKEYFCKELVIQKLLSTYL